MTIFSPGDNVDTFEVGPGEIVFIPSAYFHYIENVNTSEDMQFAVFFDDERPEDKGSGAFGAYSNEVLGSVFGLQTKSPRFVTKISGGSLCCSRRLTRQKHAPVFSVC